LKKKVKVEGVKCKRKAWLRRKEREGDFVLNIVLILFLVSKIVFFSENYEINYVRFLKLFFI